MITRQQLLEWLIELEDDAAHPERYDAMRNGQRLVELAAREALIPAGPQGAGEFAQTLAQLKSSDYLDWHWQLWPSGMRDAEEPATRSFSAEHLQRCDDIRVRATAPRPAASGPTPNAQDEMSLEPEQEQLLVQMVEAARSVPRDKQEFLLVDADQGDVLVGPGGNRPVLGQDIHALRQAGLLEATQLNYSSGNTYVISAKGRRHYEEIHRRDVEPFQQVEQRVQSYLEAPDFRDAYPAAYGHWRAAMDLLWGSDATDRLTAIGHEAREAMQEFATALVQRHDPPDVVPDPTMTKDRVSAVLLMHRSRIGTKRRALLDALFRFWSAGVDLVQRQTHGGLKEGEPLTWDDGRRVVFQTANLMVELHRALDADVYGAEPDVYATG
jgi:hypothetical protein